MSADETAESLNLGVIDDAIVPADLVPLESTPVPVEYDIRQFAFQAEAVKWDLLAFGAGILALGVTRWDWGTSGFHFVSEDWFGRDTYNGGMDKLGHAYMSYALADYFTWRIQNSFADAEGAEITGAALSLGVMMGIEVSDGLSAGYGFSYQDVAMNIAGAGFSLIRNRFPELKNKVDFRLEYLPSGNKEIWDFGTDYMGQKYLLALKPAGFETFKETPLRFVELQVGYYARGFEGGPKPTREQNLFVGVGLNLAEIYGAITHGDNSLASQVVTGGLHHVQVPYTYLRAEEQF